tara:strand:- start:2789 stop:3274 length:486 start_codon:yes stop_codon:yes gene_type:complete
MNWRSTLGVAFFGCLALVGCRSDQPGPLTWEVDSPAALELTELNRRLTEAYENEDIAALRGFLADDHVHNNVFGFAMGKDQFLSDIESGTLEFLSYETPEIRWHLQDDVAIATGLIHAKAERGGKAVPAEKFRFTRIFVRREGEWKVLLFHNTMDGKPPGA